MKQQRRNANCKTKIKIYYTLCFIYRRTHFHGSVDLVIHELNLAVASPSNTRRTFLSVNRSITRIMLFCFSFGGADREGKFSDAIGFYVKFNVEVSASVSPTHMICTMKFTSFAFFAVNLTLIVAFHLSRFHSLLPLSLPLPRHIFLSRPLLLFYIPLLPPLSI